jgi:serine/threonine-protein kinase
MSVPQHVDRQAFLAHLRQSGLLSAAELDEALADLPATNRGRVVARALVERGLLTRFQAERLLVGRTAGFLLGQYRILDELGKGGMGRVFKAEHLTMKRVVALKVLMPNLLRSDRARELFLREVRAIAQLVHPNVVTAYDAAEEAGRFYLVMEYVDGPNLEQLVRSRGPLSVGLACDYVRQTANGLQGAHALGMVHRDIKPANILVQRRGLQEHSPGLIKVSDFGLARLHSPQTNPEAAHHAGTILTRENMVMGTPDYLSPEQARNLHGTDIRSDLYSLGCTFYFLLTGQVPYPGGTALEKLIRHSAEVPAPVTNFRDDVPPPVRAVLERLLAKAPAERFQTPAELAAALEPYAVSGPTPWAPSPPAAAADAGEAVTPVGTVGGPGSVLDSSSSEELAALAGTLPPAGSLTPVIPRPPVRRLRRWPQPGWRKKAFFLAAGVAALIAAFALFALLAGR